jgi:hypothetical protein
LRSFFKSDREDSSKWHSFHPLRWHLASAAYDQATGRLHGCLKVENIDLHQLPRPIRAYIQVVPAGIQKPVDITAPESAPVHVTLAA